MPRPDLINDAFTMSAVLQECGSAPEDIRTCLDHRATAKGILEHLEWLLGDARSGDQRCSTTADMGRACPSTARMMTLIG